MAENSVSLEEQESTSDIASGNGNMTLWLGIWQIDRLLATSAHSMTSAIWRSSARISLHRIPQDPILWLDMFAAIQARKLPTIEECIATFDRIRHSADMDTSKVLIAA